MLWNSNMDTLQLLTLSLSGRCAFSVLTLLVPHLLPPGSFAILLMADTGSLFPNSALLMHHRMWIAYFFFFFVITHPRTHRCKTMRGWCITISMSSHNLNRGIYNCVEEMDPVDGLGHAKKVNTWQPLVRSLMKGFE